MKVQVNCISVFKNQKKGAYITIIEVTVTAKI